MLKVGLTGGIGSGKTIVAKIFSLLGVPVYDADTASKELYHTDKQLVQQLKEQFGEDIYTNNELNRAKLASIVFNDPLQLDKLNALVHPPTIKHAESWMSSQTAPYVIKEAALIFESGSSSGLDLVIGVRAPRHLRLKRAMDRDNLKKEEVENRMKRQIDEDIKMRLCDFVIMNDEQQLVIPQVIALHEKLTSLAVQKH